jgi:hypothetical protein
MADDKKPLAKRIGTNFVRGAFSVALALLMVLLLRGIAVQITPPPAPNMEPYPDVSSEEKCDAEGGRWILQPDQIGDGTRPVAVSEKLQPYCQGPLQFERERQQQDEASRQTSLFVFALGGALAVVAGLLVVQLKPVTPGLLLGGIVSFFIAGVHIWTLAPGLGRLVTIVLIFLALLGAGVFAFRENK